MTFEVENKVAVVTGGASGIGLAIVKNLLILGAKGVTIADVMVETGETVLKNLENEFGSSRVIFVKTDVVNFNSFEDAFKVTLEHFGYIDILFNNAAVNNEVKYERTIDVNVKGVVNGLILGMENYLKNHKSGQEGIIVNTSSLAGIERCSPISIYSGTKFAVTGFTVSFGDQFHYDMSKVRVFAICPGFTDTPMATTPGVHSINTLRPGLEKLCEESVAHLESTMQSPGFVAKEALELLGKAPNGSIWIINNTEPAYEFVLPDKDTFKPKSEKNE